MSRSFSVGVVSIFWAVGLATQVATAATPPVGTVRQWLGQDVFNGSLARKNYTLRGVGMKVEVWVAVDTAFPVGDCRSQVATSTEITDAQVAHLVAEFDGTVFPRETATFSTPPDRDGSNAILGPDANGNGGHYEGDGDKTVILVDNIRDGNFYQFPATTDYVDGVFLPQLNDLLDRNVVTLDAFDWLHRTTANPPDAPSADPCTSRPAVANFYESALAREWEKLALSYTDPSEATWVAQGLSDFARTLTGYVDGTATVFDRGGSRELYCFQGFGSVQTPFNPNPVACGGPESSLTVWGDGGPNALPAERGQAYAFMLFLFDHYGADVVGSLHRDGSLHGIANLDAALQSAGVLDTYGVIHDFQSMVFLDGIIGDSPRATFRETRRYSRLQHRRGEPKSRVTTPSLRSTLNLANPDAYDDPGAAPNGADYVPLQTAGGQVLAGRDLRSVSFAGAAILPPHPLDWSIVTNDPDRAGNPVLFSGNTNDLDVSAVTQVTVPTVDPTLRFLAKYGAEFGFDYGYVQVSSDGGQTYTSVAGDRTVSGPLGPGLNGTTNGFEAHAFDLSSYAGQTVLLSFRYVSDGGVNEGGLLLDDITIGATAVSDGSDLAPFASPTQVRPIPVHNWNLRLVGYDEGDRPRARQIEFDGQNTVELRKSDLKRLSKFQKIVAIVAYDEPTETQSQYAPYTLSVNGVVQPGGS